jgi:hypothetical protein
VKKQFLVNIRSLLYKNKPLVIRSGVFIYILFVYFMLDGFYAVDRFNNIGLNVQGNYGVGEYVRQGAFIFENLVAVFVIFLCVYSRSRFAIPFLLVLWLVTVVDLSYFYIQNKPIGISDIAVLNAAIGNLFDSIEQFGSDIWHATAMSATLFLPALIFTLFNRTNRVTLWLAAIGTAILLLLYFLILIVRGEPALIGFPKGYSYGFGSSAIELNKIVHQFNGAPSLPVTAYSNHFKQKKIIVVIDESVEWRMFQEVFQSNISGIIDYGKAWSGANCSAASNYIIRKATWQRDTDLRIRPIAGLFELAKTAGYKTVYIDNQNVLSAPTVRNYFDDRELADIQEVVLSDLPPYARDRHALSYLKEAIDRPEKMFILINKVGAHFPYANYISPSNRSGDPKANYYAALREQADGFINELSKFVSSETIVFYTSDHGQNLNGSASQCSSGTNIDPSEYSVPFIILTGNNDLKHALESRRKALFGRLTHLEWSESIRNQLGYQVHFVGSVFKEPHLIKSSYCGIYGSPITVFGIGPRCVPLEQ